MALQGHPRSLILAPMESPYATFYHAVNNSNLESRKLGKMIKDLDHTLPRFRDIPDFLLRTTTPPLFHLNFMGVPLGLDCRRCGSEERSPERIINVINFELVQPICSRYINVTDRQTGGQTDGRLTIAKPR